MHRLSRHIDPRYCRDYLHGSCDRLNCRYEHATVAELMGRGEDVGRLIFCRDFQRSNCFRPAGTCRFIHATTRDEQYYRAYKMLPPHLQNLHTSISPALLNPSQTGEPYLPPAPHSQLPGVMLAGMPAPPQLHQSAMQHQPGLQPPAPMMSSFSPANGFQPAYVLSQSASPLAQTLITPSPVSSVTSLHPSSTSSVPLVAMPQPSPYPPNGYAPSLHPPMAPNIPRAPMYNGHGVAPLHQPHIPVPNQTQHTAPANRPMYLTGPPTGRLYYESKYRPRTNFTTVERNLEVVSYQNPAFSQYQNHVSEADLISSHVIPGVDIGSLPAVVTSMYSTTSDSISSMTSSLELMNIAEEKVSALAICSDVEASSGSLESSAEESCA